MKNKSILSFSIFFFSLITPICIFASTPNFTSEAEIDAYYDKQKEEIRDYYGGKIKEVEEWRDEEISKNKKWLQDKTVEIYKKYLGENLTWEMIGKYFPENNPNPEEVYNDTLYYPTIDGISKLKMIYFVNTDLYERLQVINKERIALNNAIMEKTKEEIAKYNVVDNTNTKKEKDIRKDKAITTSIQIEDKIIINKNNITPNSEDITKKVPEIKLKWYQKIFNWFKK